MKILITTDTEILCDEDTSLVIYGYLRKFVKDGDRVCDYQSGVHMGWDERIIVDNANGLQIAANLFLTGLQMISDSFTDLHPHKNKLDQAISLIHEVVGTDNYNSTEKGTIQ